jgi:hypothetical protein
MKHITSICVGAIAICFIASLVFIFTFQRKSQSQFEQMRQEIIESRYSLYRDVDQYAPPRAIRMRDFCEKAKGYIMILRPEVGKQKGEMTEAELNAFVVKVFEEAEVRRISPWIPLAFAQVESSFLKMATSVNTPVGKARGLFQFLPSTAKMLLGSAYRDNCEFDVRVATQLWFEYWDVLSTMVDDYDFETKLKWVAVGYLCGERTLAWAPEQYMTPDAFLIEYSKTREHCPPDYAKNILTAYHQLYALDYSGR